MTTVVRKIVATSMGPALATMILRSMILPTRPVTQVMIKLLHSHRTGLLGLLYSLLCFLLSLRSFFTKEEK